MSQAADRAKLEAALGRSLPAVYVRFLEEPDLDERYVWNLPFHSAQEKLAVTFVSPSSVELFEVAGIEPAGHLPLCVCGNERLLLAVDLSSDDCPVYVCDEGFQPHARSLEAFLEGLVARDATHPLETLQATADVASKHLQGDNPGAALAALSALELRSSSIPEAMRDDVSRVMNMKGVALEDLQRYDEAMNAYGEAFALGSIKALRNLLGLLRDDVIDLHRGIAVVEELTSRQDIKDASLLFDLYEYLVEACCRANDAQQAERHLTWVLAYFRSAARRLDRVDDTLESVGNAEAESLRQWLRDRRAEKPLTAAETKELVAAWIGELSSQGIVGEELFDRVVQTGLRRAGGQLDMGMLTSAARLAVDHLS